MINDTEAAQLLKDAGIPDARLYSTLRDRTAVFNRIAIRDTEDGKQVFFVAPLYVNKISKVSFSYSDVWSDMSILNDSALLTQFINRYGADSLK